MPLSQHSSAIAFWYGCLNHEIKRLHERCLRIVYNDNYSSSEELLNIESSFLIHHRNVPILVTETFRIYNEVFLLNPEASYSFRNQKTFTARSIHAIHYGSNLPIKITFPDVLSFSVLRERCHSLTHIEKNHQRRDSLDEIVF